MAFLIIFILSAFIFLVCYLNGSKQVWTLIPMLIGFIGFLFFATKQENR